MNKKSIIFLMLSSLLTVGCNASSYRCIEIVEEKDNVTPFDEKVVLSLDLYKDRLKDISNIEDSIWNLNKLFDNKKEYEGIVNLATLNNCIGNNEEIEVSDTLFNALKEAIKITKLTKGIFNFTMGGVISMWEKELVSFGDENAGLYKEDQFNDVDINNVLLYSPDYFEIDEYILLNEERKTVQLLDYRNGKYQLDFEQIKRGLTLDMIDAYSDWFASTSSIKIGYTSQEVLNNHNNKKWDFILENPSFEQFKDGRLMALEFDDNQRISVSTDAYKHYVVCKGDAFIIRSDVLDGRYGKANNFYRQVALFSSDCPNAVLDALSSVIFNIGEKSKVEEMIKTFELEYKCSIEYILCKPYTLQDINSFYVEITENLYDKVRSSSVVKSVKEYKKVSK